LTAPDLGACVLVAMAPDCPRAGMGLEGVVREVVPVGRLPRTPRVLPVEPRRALVPRYVVQIPEHRLLRSEPQMVVVWP
jgi:hypothetical protein